MDTLGVKLPNIDKKDTKYWYYANNFTVPLLVEFFKILIFKGDMTIFLRHIFRVNAKWLDKYSKDKE